MARPIDSKTEGLDLYVHLARVFADSPWLHYGLWEKDEHVSMPGLRQAQERYVEKLLTCLPPPPAQVLDIGGGTGAMAALLVEKGYEVDMLTPSTVQVEAARTRLPTDRVHLSRFEDFSDPRTFDVLLFSESFQYVPLSESLPRLGALLGPGGRIVIADCFRKDNFKGGLYPGGGHKWSEFETAVAENGLRIDSADDVTARVAPTMALDQLVYREFAAPLLSQLDKSLAAGRPILHWFAIRLLHIFMSREARFRFRERLKADYRSPERFAEVNTYRFVTLTADRQVAAALDQPQN